MTTSHEELILISGASTGMGAATARELTGRGYHVLAGVRRERDAEALRAPGSSRCSSTSPIRGTSRRSPAVSPPTRRDDRCAP